jgi:hypothetical protein
LHITTLAKTWGDRYPYRVPVMSSLKHMQNDHKHTDKE